LASCIEHGSTNATQITLALAVLVMFQRDMERLTPEALAGAINAAPSFAREGLSAPSELWRQAAARSLSISILEELVNRDAADNRQLTLPLNGIQTIADEA
jgi:hypothetical protein